MKISKYIRDIRPYQLTSSLVREQVTSGKKAFKVNWNESTEDIHGGFVNLYGPTNLSEFEHTLKNEMLLNEFDSVLIYSGCDHAHLEACRVYLDDEKTVLIVGPTYDNFRVTAESFGAKIIYFNDNYRDLESFLSMSKPDCVYICNPNNPTGIFVDLVPIVEKFDSILFFIDEAYIDFTNRTYSSSLGLFNNVLIFRTLSKAWALAGIRIGYILSADDRREDLLRLYNPKFLNIYALNYILDIPQFKNHVFRSVEMVKENRAKFIDDLKREFNCRASEGNFVFIEYDKPLVLKKYLEQRKIYVRDFHGYHGLTGIRVTIPVFPADTKYITDALKKYK